MRGREETAVASAAPPAHARNNASDFATSSRELALAADDDFVAVTVVAIAVVVRACTLIADA